MLDSDKRPYSPTLRRFFERNGLPLTDFSSDSKDVAIVAKGRSLTINKQIIPLIMQSCSPRLTRRTAPFRKNSAPVIQNLNMEGAKWRNKAVPINKKRVTTLETSEVEGSQGESFCSIDEIPVSNSIKDESYFSEPLVTNGVETYMCIVCGEPLFLANKRLGMYDLVSLTFTKPIRSARKNISLMTSFSTSLYSQAEKRPGHVKFQCSNCNVNVGHIYDRKATTHSLFKGKEGDFIDKSAENVKYCEQLEARNFVVIR